jgi:hypothetical protein
MTGWNLPPGVTDRMIDEAAGAFDEEPHKPTREEQEGDAWEYWHLRAVDAEGHNAELIEALIWCSASQDFQESGIAREGWLKLCKPLLDAFSAGKSE